MKYREIENTEQLIELLTRQQFIESYAFQHIDFSQADHILSNHTFSDCIFLGCTLPERIRHSIKDNCIEFPMIEMPFNPFLNKLYTKETLYHGYKIGQPETYNNTPDKIIYEHFIRNEKEAIDIKETLTRRLHDHAVTDAMFDFLSGYEERKLVAIMGGHSLLRNDSNYLEITKISKKLTENGYLMISGGGPGAMEATHVGAWFSGKKTSELHHALEILTQAPDYRHPLWLDTAFEVLSKFPHSNYNSLGIPTWLYGHEPPTPFATHIAKYFANSVREEGLLAIAKGGVIYAPGSAGTIQEIFQDATQNHYLSFGYASPMVFFNRNFWAYEAPIYPLLKHLSDTKKYNNLLLSSHDSCEGVVAEIMAFTNKVQQ